MKAKDAIKNGFTKLADGELVETEDLAKVWPDVEVTLAASGAENGGLSDYTCAEELGTVVFEYGYVRSFTQN